jgi:hypothetical protein
MRLDALQYKLETIYEFQVEQRIDDYLTTDQKFVAEITRSEGSAREQVLLRQEGNDYWLSLYLDEQVYNRFSQPSVPEAMCHQQAGDFCLAVEGVSHFLYLCWNVNYEREVTKLELELQAEVDKYLMLLEFATTDSGLVHPWLFDNWKLEEGLNDEEQARYEKANRYASKYCKGLQQRYTGIGQTNEMLRELRRFYRKTQKQKLHMIDSLNTR